MSYIMILCSGGDDISQREVSDLTYFGSKVVSIKTIVDRGENKDE